MDKASESGAYTYSREEMLIIRENAQSRTRPSYLSTDFNNESGFFSPDRWLRHLWDRDGIEPKLDRKKMISNKIPANMAGGRSDESTILSPQRRVFSSGCKAPSISHGEERSKPRWKADQNINNIDFKPEFQKVSSHSRVYNGKAMSGRSDDSSKFNSIDKNKRNTKFQKNIEKADDAETPEWLDEGPNSMMDVIELKGFEDEFEEFGSGHRDKRKGQSFNDKSKIKSSKGGRSNRRKSSSSSSRSRKNSDEKKGLGSGSSPGQAAVEMESKFSDKSSQNVTSTNKNHVKLDEIEQSLNIENRNKDIAIRESPSSTSQNSQTIDEKPNDSEHPNFDIKITDEEFAAFIFGDNKGKSNNFAPNDQADQPSSSRFSHLFSNIIETSGKETATPLDGCRNASKFEDALSPTSTIRPIIGQKQGDLVKQRQNMVQTPKIFEKLFSKSTPPATEQQVPYIDMDKDKNVRDRDEFSTNKNCYTLEEIEGHLSTNLGAPHRSIQRHILNHSPLLEKVSFNTCSQQELNLSRQLSQLPQATSANILPDILNSRFAPPERMMTHARARNFTPVPGLHHKFESSLSRAIHPLQAHESMAYEHQRQNYPPSADPDALRAQFNQHLMARARLLQGNPNSNIPLDLRILRTAFFQLLQDPSMRQLLAASGSFSSLQGSSAASSYTKKPPFSYNDSLPNPPQPPFNQRGPMYHHGPVECCKKLIPHNQPFRGGPLRPLPNHQANNQIPQPYFVGTHPGRHSPQLHSNMMPTSVIRQMTKVPILGSSNTTNSTEDTSLRQPPAMLQRLFASSTPYGKPITGNTVSSNANGFRLEELERDIERNMAFTYTNPSNITR